MELDNINLQTTWNDAAQSLNSNFAKIVLAIASLEAQGGGIDEEQLEEYLSANGYTTEEWVLGQSFLKAIREGDFVVVNGNVVGVRVDSEGGLGDTGDGLGIVKIPESIASLFATSESFSTLSEALSTVESEIAKFNSWFGKDEDGIYTDENFRSSKNISAAGAAEEGGGGESSGEYKMYTHYQSSPSTEWRIEHYLGKMPNVKVVDSLKQLCYCDVIYENTNVCTLRFNSAESGYAYLD